MEATSVILGIVETVLLAVVVAFIWWLVKPPEQVMGVLWLGIEHYWTFTRQDRLRNLKWYRMLLKEIKEGNREAYGLLLDVVLLMLIFLAFGGIIFPAVARLPLGIERIATVFALLAGIFAVVLAIAGMRFQQDVRQHKTAIARLDQQIATLRAKLPDGRAGEGLNPAEGQGDR